MCFPFSSGKGKHINKIPRKSQGKAGTVPGQSRDNPGTIPWTFCLFLFMCFLVCWFFPGPNFWGLSGPRPKRRLAPNEGFPYLWRAGGPPPNSWKTLRKCSQQDTKEYLNQSGVTPANQTKKGQFMNFSQGHSGTKVQCESCLFSQGKTPEFTKMGEIHELFVLPLSLVWFAGATPESEGYQNRSLPGVKKWGVKGEVKRGKVVAKWTGLEGGKKGGEKGKRVGGKGPESTLKKPWFWYPSDWGTL